MGFFFEFMATIDNNLSNYDASKVPDGKDFQIAIVVAEWNEEITSALAQGAYNTLLKHGVTEKNIVIKHVPGAYELPLGAQFCLEDKNYDAVICVGSVIRGETEHFTFVCEAAAQGIREVGLNYNRPVIFCVLTDNNIEQSRARSGGKHGNKGDEAAVTALKMADF